AVGVLLGSLAQFLFQTPFLKEKVKNYRLRINLREPGVRKVGMLIFPVIISLATVDINTVVDTRFASLLPQGSVADLGYAIRIWLLPLGVFAIAIATVLFPTFSKLAEKNNIRELRKTFGVGSRIVFLIVIPSALWFMVLSVPVVKLLFQRGEFLEKDTYLTASALFYYSVGLVAAGQLHMVNRAFYALKDTITPMIVAGFLVFINYFGDWLFMNYLPDAVKLLQLPATLNWLAFPHGGIALSTSVVTIVNYVVLLEIIRRRINGIEGKKTAIVAFKITIASFVFALCSFWGWKIIYSTLAVSTLSLIVSLGSGTLVGIILFFILLRIMHVEELDLLIGLVKEKMKRDRKE
ncbi:MAG: oligosaccharide flippase family protein, partial [Actinomycetia bacterium]|nr:oligosaccharide flippase family protein [Actinomycetes bacterium]